MFWGMFDMTEESIEELSLRHEADAHRLGLAFRLDQS